ncbi:MAG: GNAT family N-acetyltransferase [Candidatus Thorarchaeota archaeon]
MTRNSDNDRFSIIANPSKEDVIEFQKGFESYNLKQTDGEFNSPKDWISLVLKDHEGRIVGGVMTSMVYWTQYLDVLWVDDMFKGLGYGKDLVLEAERIARRNGCLASQTYTFSWQAPDFYQAIGYKMIATYEGYVNGIREHILMKRLDTTDNNSLKKKIPSRFGIYEDSTEESQKIVHAGMGKHVDEQVGELRRENREIRIKSIIKNDHRQVIGGILGYTTLGTMNIEEFWVDERYHSQGYGIDLLMKAEALARENNCIAVQTACFTFQNLDFFHKHGYSAYGVSDAYPNGVKEYYLIKKF